MFLLPFLASFVVAVSACFFFTRICTGAWMDKPGARSLHVKPVSRLGGVAIWSGVIVGMAMLWPVIRPVITPGLLMSAAVLWLVAVIDDWCSISAVWRIIVQLLVAASTVYGAGVFVSWSFLSWIWPWLGILVLLWGINLYNFMDGMDGFAAGMAVVGFSSLGVLGWWAGSQEFALLCWLVVTACLGFLCFNFPPASIFMGDSGSTVLGFAMVVLGITGWQRDLYPVWVPLVVFSPFWVDATLTLLSRLARGEIVWQAHRQHYYQRWVLAGYSHKQVVLCYYLLMVACAGSVMAWQAVGGGYNEMALPVAWGVFYGGAALVSGRWLKTKFSDNNQ